MVDAIDPGVSKPEVAPAPHLVLTIAAAPLAPAAPASFGKAILPWAELAVKALPVLIFVIFALAYRTELSSMLRTTGRFEGFGVKWERSGFTETLVAATLGKLKTGPVPQQGQTDALYNRLNLAAKYLDGKRVLWVDDKPENNFDLRKILTRYGLSVDIAVNNSEAQERMGRHDYMVIISDYGRLDAAMTNGGDGGTLAKWVSTNRYDAPFLFYTASIPSQQECVDNALLTNKPIELLDKVAQIGIEGLAGNQVQNQTPDNCFNK